jgi:hypothetical protein
LLAYFILLKWMDHDYIGRRNNVGLIKQTYNTVFRYLIFQI